MTSVLPDIALSGHYSKVETSRLLGIGRSTLDQQIACGNIRVVRHRYTKRVSIKGSEIVRYFNARL